MFDFIQGTLVRATKEEVTLSASGVGYRIFITNIAYNKLPELGKVVTLYVSFVIREFAHTLYGFLQTNERELFEALLNVTGIGPKTAMAIIGYLPAEELSQALLRKDTTALCRVPGIGKKTAERLLIELKDTLPLLATMQATANIPQNPISHDAISALMNLGYNQLTAQKAVRKVMETNQETNDLSLLISLSLKNV